MTAVWPLNFDQKNASLQELLEAVEKFLTTLVGHMGLELSCTGSEENGVVSVDITGPDRAVLLSNAAALLNSLEYLVNKVFRTGKGERVSAIMLGSENYRQHREAELVLLAKMASKKVIAQKRPLNLQPMVPRERRIIHLALAEVEGVRSQSTGEGENRSITIYPTD